jgi:D-inositol-3-phosphate glycosyltransferase
VTPRLGQVMSVRPRRVAVLSVHTSPLEQPGTGDAGGMNVYVVETSTRLAERGVEVEVFTRATRSDLPPVVELAPGVVVRHVTAGPFEGLSKEDLPAQLCALTSGVLRPEAAHEPGWYDVVHSHYWLSGQVGWLASERWGVPLVHTAHTLAKVKNLALPEGDAPSRCAGWSVSSRSSRRPTGSWPTPSRRPGSWSTFTTPTHGGS